MDIFQRDPANDVLRDLLVESLVEKGGSGSGFHGHRGRPGQLGGSSSSGTSAPTPSGSDLAIHMTDAEWKQWLHGLGISANREAISREMQRLQHEVDTGNLVPDERGRLLARIAQLQQHAGRPGARGGSMKGDMTSLQPGGAGTKDPVPITGHYVRGGKLYRKKPKKKPQGY